MKINDFPTPKQPSDLRIRVVFVLCMVLPFLMGYSIAHYLNANTPEMAGFAASMIGLGFFFQWLHPNFMGRKKIFQLAIVSAVFIAMSFSPSAKAGGGGFAGATEWTQIANNVQLGEQYAQQVLQYETQLLQWKMEIQNLAAHPLGNISPTLNALASNQGRVLSAAKDIGNTMAKVDKDFADKFKSPTAVLFADKFKSWSDHSSDALKASMINAGLQRENFKSDDAALAALVNKNQQSQGNLSAIQTLGEINAAQIQETQKLRDLLSQQVLAQNTYLAASAEKEQAITDAATVRFKATPTPNPKDYKNPPKF